MEKVQWYPGHMAKTKREMTESIKKVDAVVEVLDARIPRSSKNPDMDALWERRPRVVVLNKADLADAAVTEAWEKYFEAQGAKCLALDSLHASGSGKAMKKLLALVNAACADVIARNKAKGMNKALKLMIVGIPNTGKSTLINILAGRAGAAKTGNKPGVTRSEQWVKLENGMMLLDTPGILWPKFEDEQVGKHIAFIGSINEEILDEYAMSLELLSELKTLAPDALATRYKLTAEELAAEPDALLEFIGKRRGHLLSGGRIDVERTAKMLMDEFRDGKIGRISLEAPEA